MSDYNTNSHVILKTTGTLYAEELYNIMIRRENQYSFPEFIFLLILMRSSII